MATPDMLAPNSLSKSLGFDITGRLDTPHPESSQRSWDKKAATAIKATVAAKLYESAISQRLSRLDVTDCINAYATSFPTTLRSLILVTANSTNLPYAIGYQSMVPLNDAAAHCSTSAFHWICNQLNPPQRTDSRDDCLGRPICAEQRKKLNPGDWRPFGDQIEYCLAEAVDQKCNLGLNPSLIGVVIAFNLIKALLLAWTFYKVKEKPLITIGDAVGSFLERTDNTTKGLCLMENRDLSDWEAYGKGEGQPLPKTLSRTRRHWASIVSKKRWFLLLLV
jgi:hypothetical protein